LVLAENVAVAKSFVCAVVMTLYQAPTEVLPEMFIGDGDPIEIGAPPKFIETLLTTSEFEELHRANTKTRSPT
jgi:hypothetical protein